MAADAYEGRATPPAAEPQNVFSSPFSAFTGAGEAGLAESVRHATGIRLAECFSPSICLGIEGQARAIGSTPAAVAVALTSMVATVCGSATVKGIGCFNTRVQMFDILVGDTGAGKSSPLGWAVGILDTVKEFLHRTAQETRAARDFNGSESVPAAAPAAAAAAGAAGAAAAAAAAEVYTALNGVVIDAGRIPLTTEAQSIQGAWLPYFPAGATQHGSSAQNDSPTKRPKRESDKVSPPAKVSLLHYDEASEFGAAVMNSPGSVALLEKTSVAFNLSSFCVNVK